MRIVVRIVVQRWWCDGLLLLARDPFLSDSYDGGSPALEVGWKKTIGSGYSSVVVGDGRAITMFDADESDVIAAFDVDSGDELWRYTISRTHAGYDGSHDGPLSTPLLADGRVYGLGGWGHLFALDALNGQPIWTTHLVDDHGATKPYYGFTDSLDCLFLLILPIRLAPKETRRSQQD